MYTLHQIPSPRKGMLDWLYGFMLTRSRAPIPRRRRELEQFFCRLRNEGSELVFSKTNEDRIFELVRGYTRNEFVDELLRISAMLRDAELELCIVVQVRLPAE